MFVMSFEWLSEVCVMCSNYRNVSKYDDRQK